MHQPSADLLPGTDSLPRHRSGQMHAAREESPPLCQSSLLAAGCHPDLFMSAIRRADHLGSALTGRIRPAVSLFMLQSSCLRIIRSSTPLAENQPEAAVRQPATAACSLPQAVRYAVCGDIWTIIPWRAIPDPAGLLDMASRTATAWRPLARRALRGAGSSSQNIVAPPCSAFSIGTLIADIAWG